jgi:hypothetical protein
MNMLKTTFLMGLLTVILVTVGGALGGEGGDGSGLSFRPGDEWRQLLVQ